MKFFEDLNREALLENEDVFPDDTKSLTGHPFTEARLCAVQAIFQANLNEQPFKEVAVQFKLFQIKKRKADKKLFIAILEDIGDQSTFERYQEMIQSGLNEKWTYDRLGSIEKALLTAAISEFYVKPETPKKVIINEFLNISKGFLKPDEVNFVNGILDKIAAQVRPE